MNSSSLIEHVAEIEMCQRISRIGLDGSAIVFLSQTVLLTVVVKRSHINVGCSMLRIAFQNLQVGRDCIRVGVWVFFERDAPREQRSDIRLFRVWT